MSLRDKTLAGIGWAGIARALKEILHFGISIALARMLTPNAYGLLGMIIVFTGFAQLFTNPGFGDAIVQREDLKEGHRSSTFWLNAGVGVGLTLLFVGVAPLVAKFYGDPRLTVLTMVVAISFTLNPLNVVHEALLRRTMNFKLLMYVDTISVVVSGAVAVTLAVMGWGVWALVFLRLTGTFMRVLVMWWVTDWHPKFMFEWESIKDLLAFSGNLFGFQLVNYWVRKADDLLVGKFVGSHGLGVYTKAYEVMLQPVKHLRQVVGQVVYPAFSKIQDDRERLKRAYLYATRALGLPSIPMMCFVFVLAEPIVVGIFGEHWREVAPVLQILCFIGVKQPVSSTTGWLFKACGKTDWQFKWNLVTSTLALISFAIGIQWGVIGMATAYAIRGYVVWYPGMVIPGKLINMSFWEFVWNQAPVFACSMVSATTIWVLRNYLMLDWAPWPQLGVLVPTALILYLALIHIFDIQAYREARDIAVEQWEKHVVGEDDSQN